MAAIDDANRQRQSERMDQRRSSLRMLDEDHEPSSADEERLREESVRGCSPSYEQLVRSSLGFVVKVANEYRGLGLPFEDLLGEGNLGLMEAARRFEADRGTKFTTYAVWWIRKSILGALSSKTQLIRSPYHQVKKMREIRQANEALRRSLGRVPSREEVSVHLSRSLRELDRTLRHKAVLVSLDQQVGTERRETLEGFLRDVSASCPEQRLLDHESKTNLAEALSRLSPRQRQILGRRFGLDGQPSETLREIAARMGVSRERVRQLEVEAKRRLRALLARQSAARSDGSRKVSADEGDSTA